jgi:hypothetical protein
MRASSEIYDYCVKNGFGVERTIEEIYLHGSDCNIELKSISATERRYETQMLKFIDSFGGKLSPIGFFISRSN